MPRRDDWGARPPGARLGRGARTPRLARAGAATSRTDATPDTDARPPATTSRMRSAGPRPARRRRGCPPASALRDVPPLARCRVHPHAHRDARRGVHEPLLAGPESGFHGSRLAATRPVAVTGPFRVEGSVSCPLEEHRGDQERPWDEQGQGGNERATGTTYCGGGDPAEDQEQPDDSDQSPGQLDPQSATRPAGQPSRARHPAAPPRHRARARPRCRRPRSPTSSRPAPTSRSASR